MRRHRLIHNRASVSRLKDNSEIKLHLPPHIVHQYLPASTSAAGIQPDPRVTPLWKSVSLTRWSLTTCWFLFILSQAILLFCEAITIERKAPQLSARLKSLFTFNLERNSDYLHPIPKRRQQNGHLCNPPRWRFVLLANTPQIFLSLTYLFSSRTILAKMVAEKGVGIPFMSKAQARLPYLSCTGTTRAAAAKMMRKTWTA
ncbi:hypothetical protein QBC45DRAFT_461877, partial [Copromyces sp. CBS 386.78]